MRDLRKILILALGLFLLTTCEESTKPEDETPLVISDVMNIVWTLDSYELEGQAMDLSTYEPFHLVYGGGEFFGDDGCNRYGGIYETNGDAIFPGYDTWMTLGSCDVKSFSMEHLTEANSYTIQADNSELTIHTSDAIYTYKSNFLKDVDSLLIDKKWVLTSSNDPQYEEIKTQQLHSTLTFDQNRVFNSTVKWYSADENVLLYNETYGVYGIGSNNTILFYHKGGGGKGSQPLFFARKILSSSSYSVEDNSLILFNEGDNTAFEFSVSDNSELTVIPDSIIARASQYIISRVGELFFDSYIAFDSSRSRYYPPNEHCIQNPSSCAEYRQFPRFLMVYSFRIPELSFVDETIFFLVDTLGNVIEEREPGGIPNCPNNDCWDNFNVIDESEAIAIAQNAGLEPGIREWRTSFHYYYGDIDDYVWTVDNTMYESSSRGSGNGVLINAYSGVVIQFYG